MTTVWRAIVANRWLLAVLTASVAIIATVMFVQVPDAINRWIPPYSVPEARIITTELRNGERLRIAFNIIRRRVCKIELQRFIITDDEADTTVWREHTIGGVGPPGDDWVIIDIPLPQLKPGKYVYRTAITNVCKEGVFTTLTPDVRFTVIP